MQVERRAKRIGVEIPVTVTTVLDSTEAAIVDLSEHGAQILGCAAPEGTRIHIDYMGETIFAQSRWAEVDRMGISFIFPLAEGLLYERLMLGRAMRQGYETLMGSAMPEAPLGARTFGRAPLAGGFGRRN